MLPHQFKRLFELLRSSFESLRSELSDIKETAKQQERTIRHASNAANQERREMPRIIASAIETANKDVPAYEKAQRDKEYRQQRRVLWATGITAGATILAFAAAAIYAAIAAHQLDQMEIATDAATRSATVAAWALGENQRQFEAILGQMNVQTVAQKKSAQAAQNAANETARQLDDLEASQRAILEVQLNWDSAQKNLSSFVKNIGKTPAVNIATGSWQGSRPCSSSFPNGWGGDRDVHSDPSGFTLSPDDPPHLLWSETGLQTEDMDKMVFGQHLCPYYTTAIAYKDIFGKEQMVLGCHYYTKGHFPSCSFSEEIKADDKKKDDGRDNKE